VNPARLLKAIERYAQYFIGSFEVNTLELVYNDWYQRQENTILLKAYPLASGHTQHTGA
jgi:hypothetical protein